MVHAIPAVMGSPKTFKKVHDIYTVQEHTVETRRDSADVDRRPSFQGAINYARPRPARVPRPTSGSWPVYMEKLATALKIGLHGKWEHRIKSGTGIAHIELTEHTLTVYRYSQSKLSQQELIDLQKATHFDKKELQQWYKGVLPGISHVFRSPRRQTNRASCFSQAS